MYEVIFLWSLAFAFILFAIIQDLQTREIANWLNFSLVIFALGFRFFYSLFNDNYNFFFIGLIGFAIFFLLGNILYYSRVFAGGDAKLMISLGAVLPIYSGMFENIQLGFTFILLFLFAGFFYTIFTSMVLCISNLKNFKKEFKVQFTKYKKFMIISLVLSIVLLFVSFFEMVFFYFAILLFAISYLFIYSKAVDESCMIKNISTKQLTEGDWLYSDVKIGRGKIKAKWDGLTKREIKELIKRYKKVRIRQGIPFSPVFLISFVLLIITAYFGINLWNSFWQP